MANAEPDPHLVPRLDALKLDSVTEDDVKSSGEGVTSPTGSDEEDGFDYEEDEDFAVDEDEFLLETPSSAVRSLAPSHAPSDTSSYVFASRNQTPSTASDFEYISDAVSEDGWSHAASRPGETPLEDVRAQLSHLELYERLRAAAIARSESESVPRSSASSPPPSETTEAVDLMPSTATTTGTRTPSHPDFTPRFAPDGTYLGRASDTMDESGGPGSKTPQTYDDVPQELKDEMAAFRHERLAENGLLPKEELDMKPEWFLEDDDIKNIEELLGVGFTIEEIQTMQQQRYLELSTSNGATPSDPWLGFFNLYKERHRQQDRHNPYRDSGDANNAGWEAPVRMPELDQPDPRMPPHARAALEAYRNPHLTARGAEATATPAVWDGWSLTDDEEQTPAMQTDSAPAGAVAAAVAEAGPSQRATDVAVASTRVDDFTSSTSSWRHGPTYMLEPPAPDYRLMWQSDSSPFTASQFVCSMLPSRTPGDTIYVRVPGSPRPLTSRGGSALASPVGGVCVHIDKRRYADALQELLAVRASLHAGPEKGSDREMSWYESRLVMPAIYKAEDAITSLTSSLKCWSGAFVFRATTDNVDAIWTKLVGSLCGPDGALRQESKVHTLSVRVSRTRMLDLERPTSITREYDVSAFVSNIFDNFDVEKHRQLFEVLGLEIEAVVPDVWHLLGYQPGRVLKLGNVEPPLVE